MSRLLVDPRQRDHRSSFVFRCSHLQSPCRGVGVSGLPPDRFAPDGLRHDTGNSSRSAGLVQNDEGASCECVPFHTCGTFRLSGGTRIAAFSTALVIFLASHVWVQLAVVAMVPPAREKSRVSSRHGRRCNSALKVVSPRQAQRPPPLLEFPSVSAPPLCS